MVAVNDLTISEVQKSPLHPDDIIPARSYTPWEAAELGMWRCTTAFLGCVVQRLSTCDKPIMCSSYRCWMARLMTRWVPASFWCPGLEPHIEELPRLMTRRVFSAFWQAQILLSCAYQVL